MQINLSIEFKAQEFKTNYCKSLKLNKHIDLEFQNTNSITSKNKNNKIKLADTYQRTIISIAKEEKKIIFTFSCEHKPGDSAMDASEAAIAE